MNTQANTHATFAVSITGIALTATAKLRTSGTTFPNEQPRNGMRHNRFTVTVKSSNGSRTSFAFYDSASNYAKGITELNEQAIKDAVGCFVSDAMVSYQNQDAEDMMYDFGWDTDSRSEYKRAKAIYKACQASAAKLARLGIDENALYELGNLLND